jgi:hypothetical protein
MARKTEGERVLVDRGLTLGTPVRLAGPEERRRRRILGGDELRSGEESAVVGGVSWQLRSIRRAGRKMKGWRSFPASWRSSGRLLAAVLGGGHGGRARAHVRKQREGKSMRARERGGVRGEKRPSGAPLSSELGNDGGGHLLAGIDDGGSARHLLVDRRRRTTRTWAGPLWATLGKGGKGSWAGIRPRTRRSSFFFKSLFLFYVSQNFCTV